MNFFWKRSGSIIVRVRMVGAVLIFGIAIKVLVDSHLVMVSTTVILALATALSLFLLVALCCKLLGDQLMDARFRKLEDLVSDDDITARAWHFRRENSLVRDGSIRGGSRHMTMQEIDDGW